VLWAFTGAAVVGFATFGRHPELLAQLPRQAAEFYAISFAFFAQAQVWLAGLVLGALLIQRVGGRWLAAFGLAYGTSLASELAGTTWGVPFGAYSYSGLLGPAWLERVPVVIPLSWFAMALPAYALARRVHPVSVPARIGFGSIVLLSWDLALDPAMSAATRYWEWGATGPYYGMPWLNLLGWYATGVVLMGVLVWRDDGWVARLPLPWLLGFFGANLALALGMCAAAGLWGAVAATAAAVGVWSVWSYVRLRARSTAALRALYALEPTP
jgi:putative membrane protein